MLPPAQRVPAWRAQDQALGASAELSSVLQGSLIPACSRLLRPSHSCAGWLEVGSKETKVKGAILWVAFVVS